MRIIACLFIEPTEAIAAVCAQLTPVIEPMADRIVMDWTGCGPVQKLARQLAEGLHALHREQSSPQQTAEMPPRTTPKTLTGERSATSDYRLGVAPLRFIAEALATSEFPAASRKGTKGNDFCQLIAGGEYVPEHMLAACIRSLPVARLPHVDEKTKETLEALAVPTLGALGRVQAGLLRDHVGRAADTLLAWAAGDDPRPVVPLYPPERLHERVSRATVTNAYSGAPERRRALVEATATPLIESLQTTGRGAIQISVACGERRHTRTFAEPLTEAARITRLFTHLLNRLLADALPRVHDGEKARGGEPEYEPGAFLIDGDPFIFEIVPADATPEQMRLWDGGKPRNARRARLQKVLDSLRDRFGDAIGRSGPREAVARYETMLHLYEAKG